MDHKTFGKVVAALRKEQVNFLSGHNWIQQDLANQTGLTPRIVGRIERGAQARLDGEVLQKLADSFELTSLERREFFAMASEVMDSKIVRRDSCGEDVFKEVWELLENLCVPAFIADSFSDLIGANRCFMAFHDLDLKILNGVKDQYKSINNLALILDSKTPMRKILGRGWREIALANLQQWRVTTLRYRHTSRFRKIISLLSACPEFRVLWAERNEHGHAIDDCSRLRRCVYTHGVHGPVGGRVHSFHQHEPYRLWRSLPFVLRASDPFHHESLSRLGEQTYGRDPSVVVARSWVRRVRVNT